MSIAPTEAFKGRTVIITGAGGSIGRPLSFAFARAGASVVVNELGGSANGQGSNPSIAEDIASEINALGFSAVADTHSVTDPDAIVNTAISHFGRVDIVINNAGIIEYGPLEQQTADSIRKVFEVNTLGAINLIRCVWKIFKEQNFGRVINFTSDSIFGMPYSTSYVLSRGAIMGVTRSLALEAAPHDITVNAVGPTSYSRMVNDLIDSLPPDQQAAMKGIYTGDSNVPLIMALAHESNRTTGEIFSIGGYSIGKVILGSSSHITGCETMDKAQKGILKATQRSDEWIEPKSIEEAVAFRTAHARTVDT
jgi:NAD(P)-dependent dehydrogenase (short-subunit alcohol dehydrogenase family)